jgi:hypothetical protein
MTQEEGQELKEEEEEGVAEEEGVDTVTVQIPATVD